MFDHLLLQFQNNSPTRASDASGKKALRPSLIVNPGCVVQGGAGSRKGASSAMAFFMLDRPGLRLLVVASIFCSRLAPL